jgi:hypothetical protein
MASYLLRGPRSLIPVALDRTALVLSVIVRLFAFK